MTIGSAWKCAFGSSPKYARIVNAALDAGEGVVARDAPRNVRRENLGAHRLEVVLGVSGEESLDERDVRVGHWDQR